MKSSAPSTVSILSIGSYHFHVASAAQASKIAGLLGSLEPVQDDYEQGDIGFYFYRSPGPFHRPKIELRFNVDLYPSRRRLGLPAPSDGDQVDPSNPHRG